MAKVFISYRRNDAAGYAGWAHDLLESHIGAGEIFLDQQALMLGDDWRRVIERKLGACSYFVAIIGPRWAGDLPAHNRLVDPNDMVRFEVASALERAALDELKFIVLLVDGAPLPQDADLPEDIRSLTRYQAAPVNLANFRDVMAQLLAFLKQEDAEDPAPADRPLALELITRRDEADAAFTAFRSRIRQGAREMHIRIGHPGGSYEADVFYHPQENMWCLPDRGTSENGRFYIPFGWGRPLMDRTNSMVVQFNPAHCGDNPRVGGVWLKDGSGNSYLGHTGRVGGGAPGVGKRQFIEFHQDGNWRPFRRTASEDRAVVFGPLSQDMPLTELAQFVGKVKDFKDRLAQTLPPVVDVAREERSR